MDENCSEDGKGEVGRIGVGTWDFQNWEQWQGNCFSVSLFAPILHISNLKGILSKQHQQNEIHQIYFSECVHIPMLFLPRDMLCSLLWPSVKSWGHFLLDGVQVCYLEWKKRREQWQKDNSYVFLMSFLFTDKLSKQLCINCYCFMGDTDLPSSLKQENHQKNSAVVAQQVDDCARVLWRPSLGK